MHTSVVVNRSRRIVVVDRDSRIVVVDRDRSVVDGRCILYNRGNICVLSLLVR